MGSEMEDSVRARAIEWHIRLRHGDDADWDAFAGWLAEDASHAEVYGEVERSDLAIEPLLPHVIFREAANDVEEPAEPQTPRSRRWVLAGGALAASIAIGVALVPQFASSRYEVVTGPGERQLVTLDPGTQVLLNGSTRITFDHKNSRFASLVAGEALFKVRHDGTRPFKLDVGDKRVEDVGTIFNVVRDAGEVRVAVAEGKVIYDPEKDAIALDAGQTLVDEEGTAVHVASAPIASVGAWQTGRLVYSGEPLSRVATDLGRSLGVRITAASTIADHPFSGAIVLNGTGTAQLERLAPALNVTLEAEGDGWVLKSAEGAER